jgi:SAM-dependent methyltransferase
MGAVVTFDPTWAALHGAGTHVSRYPWDVVVSFVHRYAPRERDRRDVRILEVGCGGGANLWFAAREGFAVSGIDSSEPAVAYARARLRAESLEGDIRVGDFTELPFDNCSFDLVIDRCAITCAGFTAARCAVDEVHRVLVDGGAFLFNPYGDRHTSRASGRPGPDGVVVDIDSGTLVGVGQICFYTRADVDRALANGWAVERLERLELTREDGGVHAEWRVYARRSEGGRTEST